MTSIEYRINKIKTSLSFSNNAVHGGKANNGKEMESNITTKELSGSSLTKILHVYQLEKSVKVK